ncbi:uncharacterized protein [Apostichopus japonicus]|uniref:uncharacterized protein n=1 Tax=Stichopus japonicus TaxID=307972 RepID=UPI003AB363B8
MGELSGITPPVFDWRSHDLPYAFQNFQSYCKLIFTGPLASKSPKEQVTYLLLWMGQEGISIYQTWELDVNTKENPEEIFKRFKKHFEPKTNYRLARYKLQKLRQNHSENVDEFITRCKIQADKCKFDLAESKVRLIEQLILGTPHESVQEKLLSKDEKLTLEEALDIARTYEATKAHMKEFASATTELDLTVDSLQKQRTGSNRKCNRCGLTYPHKGKCPAFGTNCNYCEKPNHWQSVCRLKQKNETHGRSSSMVRPERNARFKSQSRLSDIPKPKGYENDNLEIEQILFSSMKVDNLNNDSNSEIFAMLNTCVNDKKATLKVKVDTGAEGNVLPLRIFKLMYPQKVDKYGKPFPSSLKHSNVIITAYSGSRIHHYGIHCLDCAYENVIIRTEFYVVDVDGPAILGLKSCLNFKLITLHCGVGLKSFDIHDIDDVRAKYPDRFEGIGKFKGDYHIVVDKSFPPVVHVPRRCPIQIKDDIKKELDDMVSMGVIEPITEPTDWVSSIVYCRKPNGKWRVCLDPKDLNKAIKRTHYHTPTSEEITHKLAQSTVFSKLDAKHGYWAVSLNEDSSRLTTFNSPFGRYYFKRLPFGLCLSQDIFQMKMNQILELCPGTIGISDDICVFGKTEQQHDENLIRLMEVAREKGLVFNPDKCEIKQPSIKFFGQIYDAQGVHPDPSKVKAMKAIEKPNNVKELQQFLGITTYMAPFIPDLSNHTASLRELLKKDVTFKWTNVHDQNFQKIKDLISEEVTLAYFDPNKESVIEVDASLKGVGCALIQDKKPVYFASKAFTETEQRYANIEREMLAVVYACERFHSYVYGKCFTVESDHKPLEMIKLKSLGAAPPRLQRFLLRLQNYDVTIRYKPGKDMLLADALSRLNPLEGESIEKEHVVVNFVQFSDQNVNEIQRGTDSDLELNALRDVIIQGWPEKRKQIPRSLQKYWAFRDELSIENGVIMKDQDKDKWYPGKVVNQRPEPRSYEIETPSRGVLRRNRRYIKEGERKVTFREPDVSGHTSDDQGVPIESPRSLLSDDTTPSTQDPESGDGAEYYYTRSGRRVNPRNVLDL